MGSKFLDNKTVFMIKYGKFPKNNSRKGSGNYKSIPEVKNKKAISGLQNFMNNV